MNKRLNLLIHVIIWSATLFASALVIAQSKDDSPQPTLQKGATVFVQRCALCHGNDGMGEGALPLSLKSYPDTNLSVAKHTQSEQEIRKAIFLGGELTGMSPLSPPWGDELTCTQLDSVTKFVHHLRTNTSAALGLIDNVDVSHQVSDRLGAIIYRTRCALCHGDNGEGDGKMAAIITNPPPFDLTKSVMPDTYLDKIIRDGGSGVGRSPQMPPWADTLNDAEVLSVINYIVGIRTAP